MSLPSSAIARATRSALRQPRSAPSAARTNRIHSHAATRRRNGPGTLLLFGAIAAGVLSTQIAASRRPVLADEPPKRAAATPLDDSVVEPASQLAFSRSIRPRALDGQQLSLVGLGIRVVSFLRVRVYAAGLFVDPAALRRVASLPDVKGTTSERLLGADSEKVLRALLDQPSDIVVRVVPTRATDWSHLRDGWVRAILGRLKIGGKAGTISDAEAERVASQSVDQLKSLFGKNQVAKGTEILLMRRGRDGTLLVECGGELLGSVDDPVLSRELMLAYVSADNVISNALRQSVAEGFARVLLA